MKFNKVNAVIIVALFLATIPAISAKANEQTSISNNNRYIVTYNSKVNSSKKNAIKETGVTTIKELGIIDSIVVESSDKDISAKLKNLGDVKSVNKDIILYAYASKKLPISTDPLQTTPWGINEIYAPDAWTTSQGAGIKVAVIDTGIDKTHSDLSINLAGGINFVPPKNPTKPVDPTAWNDDNGHGTHVAGTVAAANNTIGVVGVAPEAELYGVKVLNSSGSGYTSDIISGIEWSMNNGMNVINMSLGSPYDNQPLHDAVDKAYNAGVVVVAAAGNEGDGDASTNEVGYPARYSSVIAVAATDSNNLVASFSSSGDQVEISAPGVSIYSTSKSGTYATMSGTSMASPHVAGAVAVLMSSPISASADTDQNGQWGVEEVRKLIQLTARDLGVPGIDVLYGSGLIDVSGLMYAIR